MNIPDPIAQTAIGPVSDNKITPDVFVRLVDMHDRTSENKMQPSLEENV